MRSPLDSRHLAGLSVSAKWSTSNFTVDSFHNLWPVAQRTDRFSEAAVLFKRGHLVVFLGDFPSTD